MLLMSTGALAQDVGDTNVLNSNRPGRLYHVAKADPPRVQSNEVSLPMPIEPPLPESLGGATQLGRSFESSGFSMLSPRGGAMLSPKQRADRDVQKLIKRLG
jgi:hypothetical protein